MLHTASFGKTPAPKLKRPSASGLKIHDRIVCNDTRGPFRPCIHCGGEQFLITLGRGPHAAGLTCLGCGRRGRWLKLKYLLRDLR
jgi:hypothetical protein